MAETKKTTQIAEFGDFQTPPNLCAQVCRFLISRLPAPQSMVEPTCGVGGFLVAACRSYPHLKRVIGADINPDYVLAAERAMSALERKPSADLRLANFFVYDWGPIFQSLPKPLLVLGNPPWVTNAHLGAMGSGNLPEKTNFQGHSGFDAITGKANFDISEWMLIRLVELLNGTDSHLAMLCKTSVARKVLAHGWKNGIRISSAEVVLIDAKAHFDATVDACLLYVRFGASESNSCATVYSSFAAEDTAATWGYQDGKLLADVAAYNRWKELWTGKSPIWRSGIKHDCAAVMELRPRADGAYQNGLGEAVHIEDDCVYPMLKSSHLSKGKTTSPDRFMLVTQRFVGEDTRAIEHRAPQTWVYLRNHIEYLDRRGSSIYRDRPPFSIFGVGPYSFAPSKVAIAGLYKALDFRVIGSHQGKPYVLDDTCYFLPCETEEHAEILGDLISSDVAKEALSSFIFWDAKRPITVDVLRNLDIVALAKAVGDRRAIAAAQSCQDGIGTAGSNKEIPNLFAEAS